MLPSNKLLPNASIPLRIFLVAAVYFVSGRLGLLLAIPPGYATAFWPPAGVALSAVLLFGYRMLPGIWVGSFGLNLWVSRTNGSDQAMAADLAISLSIGCGAVAQAFGSMWLVRRFSLYPNSLSKLGDIFRFLFLAAFLGSMIAATWGVATLWLSGRVVMDEVLLSWRTWWLGDAMGVVLLTPLAAASSVVQPFWRRRVLLVSLPTAATFAIVLLIFFAASGIEKQSRQSHFEQYAIEHTHHLVKTFDLYLAELDALARFVSQKPNMDAQDFKRFAQSAVENRPGIEGLSWNPIVTREERIEFEAAMQQGGFEHFRIMERREDDTLVPASTADEYVVVKYIEPLEVNRPALGLDVSLIAERRAALERARDTGYPAANGSISLVQHPKRSDGVLIFQPVYASGRIPKSVEKRREYVRGYTALVLLLGDVLDTAGRSRHSKDVVLTIEKTDTEGARTLWYSSPTADSLHDKASVDPSYEHHFDLAGQKLALRAVPSRSYRVAHRSWEPWFVELGGLFFTSLFEIFLLFVTGQHSRQEELVSERTKELSSTNAKLQAIMDASTHTVIVATDTQGTITLFNTGAERLLGYSASEMIGKHTPTIFHVREEMEAHARWLRETYGYPEQGMQAIFARAVDGYLDQRDWTFVRKDGKHRTASLIVTPKRDERGVVIGFVGVAHDVTEARKADERFRVLFDQSSDAHLLFNEFNGIIDCNQAAIEMLRCKDKQEVLGLHPAALSPEYQPDGRRSMEKCIEMDATARRNGYHRFDWMHRRQNGEDFLCEVALTPVTLVGQSALLVVWHDLTERQKTQQALIESEERLRLSLDNSKQGFWDWNILSGEVVLDDRWSESIGFAPGDLPNRIASLERAVHPEDFPRVQAILAEHFAGREELYCVDYRVRFKTGEWVWVNATGRVCRRDADGRPLRMIGTVQDISERKNSEQILAQRAAELARSNAELEQFAYAASHDLREPLRMVQSFCGLLEEDYSERLDETARRYIGFAVDGAGRMQRLVDDLLEFSRVGRSNETLEAIPLKEVVESAWKNLAAAVVDSNARIELGELPTIFGDRGRLEQVFQNLLGNAVKFRGADAPLIRVSAARTGEEWRITVSDNGIGIDAEHVPQLFTVFRRLHTRDEYEGTGIGLALCKRIVEFHGGRIWLESALGQGTRVHFTATGIDTFGQETNETEFADRVAAELFAGHRV